jgi:glutamine amidotransferase
MCRWIAYLGDPVFLDEFVSAPCQSLIAQSRQCREAPHSATNADGFGLGWYGERETPGVFRDIRPAWSDENLRSLAHQIRSGLFLAHVRASTGTATTRANCHPFALGRHLFIHNGQIGGYDSLRRRLDMLLPDDLYAHRMGTTDSETLFLLLIAFGFDRAPQEAVARLLAVVARLQHEAGVDAPFRFTAAWADGERIYAVRYASDRAPPSLYLRSMPHTAGTLVVSEPLDGLHDGWSAVPPQCLVTVSRDGVAIEPLAIADEMVTA